MRSMIDVSVEEGLLEQVTRNDRDAFGALYDRHAGAVFAHCARQVGAIQDADDLTAIVFLEAWRLRYRIRAVKRFGAPVAAGHGHQRGPQLPSVGPEVPGRAEPDPTAARQPRPR